jgi:hypothetical protein
MNFNKKVVFIATDSSEIVLPLSRFTQGLTNASDTSVVLYFDSSIEGRPEGGYTAVTVTCSSDSEGVLTSILKNFASSRDLVIDLSNSHNNISSIAVSAGQEMSAGAGRAVVKSIANTATLYDYDSGKTILVSQAAAYTITLPGSGGTAGQRYSFVLSASAANIVKIDAGGANLMVGFTNDASGTVNDVDNNQVHFAASGTLGDRVDIISNGTKWLVQAWCSDADDIVGANS